MVLGIPFAFVLVVASAADADARSTRASAHTSGGPLPNCELLAPLGLGTIPIVCEEPPPPPDTTVTTPTTHPPTASTTTTTTSSPSLPTGSVGSGHTAPAREALPSGGTSADTAGLIDSDGPALAVPVVRGPRGDGVGHIVAGGFLLGLGGLWQFSRSTSRLLTPEADA